jgi:hypothetical protein
MSGCPGELRASPSHPAALAGYVRSSPTRIQRKHQAGAINGSCADSSGAREQLRRHGGTSAGSSSLIFKQITVGCDSTSA